MRFGSTTLILLLAVLTNLQAQTKGPAVYFETTERDLGKVTQGEIIRQVFSFTNKGPGTLEISNVEPS